MPAPLSFRVLVSILVVYAAIVGAPDSTLGQAVRVAALVAMFVAAQWRSRRHGIAMLPTTLLAGLVAGTVAAGVFGSARLLGAAAAADQMILVGATIAVIVRHVVVSSDRVDAVAVFGALSVYLLLALLFAALHQLGAAFQDGYLAAVTGRPTPGDCLYLSVITLATVGYGDVTPATHVGRVVAISEALVGQLYLVSVVAAVVAGWRTDRGQR